MRYQKVSNIIMTAVMGLYAAMGAQAADTRNPSQEPNVVSSYEYQSVSYGNTADGKTYHRVVTKRNGVTESDVTTVDENGGVLTWDTDDKGRQVEGYMNGIQLKDGNVTAKHVQASGAELGNIYGSRVEAPTGAIGGVAFAGQGVVIGVQTDETDPTSAVSVAYLQQKLAEVEEENQKLREELEALKK
ncbi:bZIP transcription factor [Megasphaera stantonii]|uniref:bZIP transcription factor n=1 Tax=Megasphaera stantonii TaxID=2144175 RepID=UPI001958C66C|nr:bZIP transcription factor [Megasphaera stantonii]MBM6733372.1 hypothetical protein [Megasphaera stantonii]